MLLRRAAFVDIYSEIPQPEAIWPVPKNCIPVRNLDTVVPDILKKLPQIFYAGPAGGIGGIGKC